MRKLKSILVTYFIILSLIFSSVLIATDFVDEADSLKTENELEAADQELVKVNSENGVSTRTNGGDGEYWFDGFENLAMIESMDNVTVKNGDVSLKTLALTITTTEDFDNGNKTNVETYSDWADDIYNASGVPEGELHVLMGDLFSDNFEGVPGQNLTEYDPTWFMSNGPDNGALIVNSTSYSGNTSLYISAQVPNVYSVAINLTPFTSAPYYVTVKGDHTDPAGGTLTLVQTNNGPSPLSTLGIYNQKWQYYDGLTRVNTQKDFDNTTWYQIKIIHEFSNDTYNAWVTGGVYDNWQIVNYATLRNTGLNFVNRTRLFGGTSWAGGGGNIGKSWYDNFKVGDYCDLGTWESAPQNIPLGYMFRNTTINYSGAISSIQFIDSVDWLVNAQVKAGYDTHIDDDLMSPKSIDSNEVTSGDFADVVDNFTVKLDMVTDGNGTPIIYQIDNNLVRTNGMLTSNPINVPWNRLWGALDITKTEPGNAGIEVTVLDGVTDQPIPNFVDLNSISIDLTSINPVQYPTLKLRAKFFTNSSDMPVLHEWRVFWEPDRPELVMDIPSNLSFPEDTDAIRFIDLGVNFNDTYTPDNDLFFIVYNESNSDNIHASINGRYLEFITPTDHWEGNETFSINCSDGEFTTTSNTFKITVEPINDPPIWTDITDIFITEGAKVNETANLIDLSSYVVDVDNSSDEVNISIVLNTNPENISVVIDASNMIDVYIAHEDYVGSAGVTLRAFDGLNFSDEYFNIIIRSVNDIPAVSLIYPDDQAIVTSTDVEISWSATDVEGSALTFDIYLTTAPDAGTVYLTNITGQNVTIPLTAGKYYWQVIPHDGTDYGICISGIWEFTVDSTLQTPTTQLIAPVYNSIVTTGSVNLRWEVGAGFETTGLTFEIYLDTNEQPLKIASDHHGLIYSAQGLQDGQTYYWTVIPKMQYGLGSVIGKCISGVWSFKIELGAPAPVVNLLSPGNSKTVGTTDPVLLWAVTYPAATSIDYIIYLDTSPDPVKLLKAGHPDEFITASDLENSKTYHWTVIPIAGNVMGTCSSGVWQFTVDTSATVPEVELNFPINNVKINNLNPKLNWTLKYGGSGAVTFDIYLDMDSPPTKLIANDHSSGNNKQVAVNDDTKYYWTVIPTAGDVEGYCLSGVWSFETDTNYTPIFDLVLELSKSKLSIEQGQFETLDITVNNNGNVDDIIKLEVEIDPSSLDKKNVIITQTEFELSSHNTKTTHMTINIPKDAKTADYKITITAVSQGALGLDQNVYDEETLDVEVLEEGASADDSLYVGSIIVLIIIIIVLVILFLMTIRKKKKAEEKPEERVPLAPEAKAVPEGEAAPSAPAATPVGAPAVEPAPEPEPEKPPAPPEEAPPPPPPEPEPEPKPEEPAAEPEPEPDEETTPAGTLPPEPEPEPVPEPELEPKPEEPAADETTEKAPPKPTPKVVPKVTTPDDKEAPKEDKAE